MATTEPQKWTATLGSTADVNALPATTPTGSGRASTSGLFPPVTQLPLDQGGIAPERGDFNALFKYLGEYLFYLMQGGTFSYSTDYNYTAGNLVMHGGSLYLCIASNGPGSAIKYPTDTAYWRQLALTSQLPTVNNGTLTIKRNGSNVATFSANQAGNTTANISVPTVGNGTITVQASGTPVGSFTVNQGGNSTINIPEATDSAFGVIKNDQNGFDLGTVQGWIRLRGGVQIVYGAGLSDTPITFARAFIRPPCVSAMCTTAGFQGGAFACLLDRSNTGMTIRVWDTAANMWASAASFTYIVIDHWK
ncbi:MAG: hypothetical protein IIZ93_06290 [Acidaminococcaceae bacterium]|nr:hypothetical protein [Acidaminococcaceae bacterium]